MFIQFYIHHSLGMLWITVKKPVSCWLIRAQEPKSQCNNLFSSLLFLCLAFHFSLRLLQLHVHDQYICLVQLQLLYSFFVSLSMYDNVLGSKITFISICIYIVLYMQISTRFPLKVTFLRSQTIQIQEKFCIPESPKREFFLSDSFNLIWQVI